MRKRRGGGGARGSEGRRAVSCVGLIVVQLAGVLIAPDSEGI